MKKYIFNINKYLIRMKKIWGVDFSKEKWKIILFNRKMKIFCWQDACNGMEVKYDERRENGIIKIADAIFSVNREWCNIREDK